MSLQSYQSGQSQSNNFDLQFHLCKQFFNMNKSIDNELDEISVILEQNKMLKDIQQQLSKKRFGTDNQLDESVNLSVNSLPFRPSLILPIQRTLNNNSFWECKNDKLSTNTTLDEDFKMKRTQINKIISEAEIQKALLQVQERCESSTIQVVKHLISRSSQISKKLRQNQQTVESLEKNRKICQQLKQIQSELEKKILDYESKLKHVQQQNANLKQNYQNTRRMNNGNNIDKQKQLSKMEIVLVLKQKMIAEDLKKLNLKSNLLNKQQEFVLEERQAVQQIWENVINKVSTPDDQFKSNIYNKCKDSLVQQRKQLQEEQNALDAEHLKIEKILAQMENLF